MYVYGKNFGIKDTMIIYPKHIVDVDDNLKLGEGEKLIRLKMKSLDLEYDSGYDSYICEMVKRFKEIL